MIIDITQQFLSYTSPSSSQKSISASSPVIRISIQAQLCYKQSFDILQNITKINNILSQNKQNYFSNAAYSYQAFTDHQRNQFDREMKVLLDGINIKIGEFKQVVDREKFFSSTTQKQHLKNMALCLYQKYKHVYTIFKQFVQFNQNRKKKLQAVLGNEVKNQYKNSIMQSQPMVQRLNNKRSQIDPQLEMQSKTIFRERMSEQKKIQETRKKLQQINGMLDVMENKVLQQELLTSSFRQIGEIGLFHIEKGNKNLVDANTLSKDSGRMWTLFFYTLAISLLVLDYLKS